MWRSRRRDPRVRDELRFHRDRLIDDYMSAGLDRQAAERKVFIEFGSLERLEEEVKDVRGRWAADALQDLRYAIRAIRRTPGFAAVAILSLALGIGANTAIFSVINAVILRPLPVAQPDRLVLLARLTPDGRPLWLPFRLFDLLQSTMKSVSGVAAVGISDRTATIAGDDELVTVDMVSGSYFDVLEIRPALGRVLSAADDVEAPAAPAAVISDSFWRRRFGGDPAAIGTAVRIRDDIFTIVGVAPRGFQGISRGRTADLIVPLRMMLNDEQRQSFDLNNFMVFGRLAPGTTAAQADAEMKTVYSGFVRAQAAEAREKDRAALLQQRAGALAAPDGFNPVRDAYGDSLVILMGSVGLVLLLACVNLSGLLLARAAARQREIAIRLAIGASRGRLIRQFLVETLVLSAAGGGLGLVLAGTLAARLLALLLNGRELDLSAAPDWRVVGFTAAIAIAASLLAGLGPAVHAGGARVSPALKEVRARGESRAGRVLVGGQLAISMVLLVGAALFIGTLLELATVQRGFDASQVLVVTVRSTEVYGAERSQAVASALVERLGALPGVRTASATQMLPLSGGLWDRTIQVEGYRFRREEEDTAGFNAVAPGYFGALRTPIIAGRDFDGRDTAASARAAIVNESFARYFFKDGSALGRRVSSNGVAYEIVGIVGDAKYQRLRDPVLRTVYIPWTQRAGNQPSNYSYLIRVASGDPRQVVPDLAQTIRSADPSLRLRRARPYTDVIDQSIGGERTMALVGAAFGGLAMLVAALGVFGLVAFQVARRTNEIAVRLALGASRGRMIAQVLRSVGTVAAAGISAGALAAGLASGVVRNLLFGVTPTDPRVFLAAASALGATALLAAWLPARRASRVDPLVALRHE
ncbi:MAG TPA: ABC transporter permease [Vicinamibacterales bacterium]|nr:ABC transporter permease [Vicinamibacterales bacterium]